MISYMIDGQGFLIINRYAPHTHIVPPAHDTATLDTSIYWLEKGGPWIPPHTHNELHG